MFGGTSAPERSTDCGGADKMTACGADGAVDAEASAEVWKAGCVATNDTRASLIEIRIVFPLRLIPRESVIVTMI